MAGLNRGCVVASDLRRCEVGRLGGGGMGISFRLETFRLFLPENDRLSRLNHDSSLWTGYTGGIIAAACVLLIDVSECRRVKECEFLRILLPPSTAGLFGRCSFAILEALVSCHLAFSSFIDRTLRKTKGEVVVFRLGKNSSSSLEVCVSANRVCLNVSAKRAISSCCFIDSGSLRGGGGTCNGKTSVRKSADKKLRKAEGLCSYR